MSDEITVTEEVYQGVLCKATRGPLVVWDGQKKRLQTAGTWVRYERLAADGQDAGVVTRSKIRESAR